MKHKIEIIDEQKMSNAVRIEIEVTLGADGTPEVPEELVDETLEHHFDMDYESYQDNEQVKRHDVRWAREVINRKLEKQQPSDPAKGETIEL